VPAQVNHGMTGSGDGWRHRLFRLAVILKAVDGVLELVGAVLLLAFGPDGVGRTVAFLTQHELAEDPDDVLAHLFVRLTHHVDAGTVHFAAAYLCAHGLVKLWLVGGLIRGRLWIFPVALALLGLFVVYQLYRQLHHPSTGLALLTVLDVAIIGLIWQEFTALRKSAAVSARPPSSTDA
jgi:uncharacterized membrane protein